MVQKQERWFTHAEQCSFYMNTNTFLLFLAVWGKANQIVGIFASAHLVWSNCCEEKKKNPINIQSDKGPLRLGKLDSGGEGMICLFR